MEIFDSHAHYDDEKFDCDREEVLKFIQKNGVKKLAVLDDAAFRTRFAGTPVKRTGRDRFVRNVVYAIGNNGEAALAPVAADLTSDSSPLVRGMAIWAARRLLDAEAFERLKSNRAPREGDASVAEEWDR